VWSVPTRRASGIVFAAACRKACCMADGVRAADANNAMGRWDSATPLGGLRACVRACVREGVVEISIRMRANCCCTAESGLGRRSIHPSHVWIGKGREGYAGGKEGLEEKRDDCTDCGILQPAGRIHSLQSSALELFWFPARVCAAALGREGKGRDEASKQASFHHQRRQAPSQYHSSPPSPSIPPAHLCAHWPTAHCELIGKRRRPTLASMLQRGARS
jgi:hypothetical protein